MSLKRIFPSLSVFLVIFLSCNYLFSNNIFHFKLIKSNVISFTFKRDIFSMSKPVRKNVKVSVEELKKEEKQKEEKKISAEDEIKNSIQYEGSLKKGDKILALINMNGDMYIVSVNDILLNKIRIVNIEKSKITVEVESLKIDILKKGENND